MANCQDINLIVNMWITNEGQGVPSVLLETLTFNLRIAAGRVTGEAFLGNVKLSDVTGTCQPITIPDGTAMTFFFMWGTKDIFMVGFTYVAGILRFRGRYRAQNHTGATPPGIEDILRIVLVEPGDGDTGTATGSQT